MDENKWLRRKPQSNLDYLGITLIAVAFYMALLNAQSFLNGVNRILGILAPFAGGVVIAYCLNPIVKAAMKYLFRGREKCRGLAILLAYIVGLAIVVLLMVLIIPQMVGSVVMFYQNFDGYAQNLLNMLKELDAETPGVDLSLAVTAVENLNASMSDLRHDCQGDYEPRAANYQLRRRRRVGCRDHFYSDCQQCLPPPAKG